MLALLSCRCVSHEQSLLRFTSPADGALLEGKQAEVHFEVRGSADGNAGMSVPADIFIEFNTTKMRYTHRKPSLYLQLQGLEPGTHVLEGVVRRSRDGERMGPSSTLSFESVLTAEDIQRHRFIPELPTPPDTVESVAVDAVAAGASSTSGRGDVGGGRGGGGGGGWLWRRRPSCVSHGQADCTSI